MVNRVIQPGVKEMAPTLRAEGLSISAAARRLGISRQTVRRVLAAAAVMGAASASHAPHAMAASACRPSTERPAWVAAPGDGVLLSTTAESMTGLVSAWLSSHHAPALVADDYQLVASPERVLVVPVRAGYVCPGSAMVQLPPDVAGDLFAAMLARSRSRA